MRVNREYQTYIFIGNLLSLLIGIAYGFFLLKYNWNGMHLGELMLIFVIFFLIILITKVTIRKSEDRNDT